MPELHLVNIYFSDQWARRDSNLGFLRTFNREIQLDKELAGTLTEHI